MLEHILLTVFFVASDRKSGNGKMSSVFAITCKACSSGEEFSSDDEDVGEELTGEVVFHADAKSPCCFLLCFFFLIGYVHVDSK